MAEATALRGSDLLDPPPSREDLWRNYQLHIDLYKHYLTILIQMNTFSFSVSGAIIVYALTHLENSLLTRWALPLPFALGILLGGFFLYARSLSPNTDILIQKLSQGLGFNVFPATRLLKPLLLTFGLLHLFIAVAAVALFVLFSRIQHA
jgi:hypothetical protein